MNARSLVLVLSAISVNAVAGPLGYFQTNLVSDGAVAANTIDPDLKNPWGISFGPTTPFWVADNGTGLSTLYNGIGVKQGLVVTIPPAPGSPAGTTSTPTGTVFNAGAAGGALLGDRFLFATEDGTIAGWQGGTTAAIRVDSSPSGAVYKGLAIAGSTIYATDFTNGKVDAFTSNGLTYTSAGLGGTFTDPTLPSGYAPFGIENIGGTLFVTYALKQPGGDDDVPGPGFGFVDEFDVNGNFIKRLISNGLLNSPWGLAMAPANFGELSSLLLVGNFGDGRINAFDPTTGASVSTLNDTSGNPIVNDGLWALKFGNGNPTFDPNTLYFTAGLNSEADGLLGSVQVAPEPTTTLLMSGALLLGAVFRHRLVN